MKKLFLALLLVLSTPQFLYAENLFDIYNNLTGSTYSSNNDLNPFKVNNDSYWTGNGKIISIYGSAGNTNTLFTNNQQVYSQPSFNGYHDYDFYNTSTNDYNMSLLTNNGSTSNLWSSDNPNTLDHMHTYDVPELNGQQITVNNNGNSELYTLQNPYLVGWEDLNLGDEDYNDLVYLVDQSTPYEKICDTEDPETPEEPTVPSQPENPNINLLSAVNTQQSNQLAGIDHRLNRLERTDFTATGKFRWLDTRKFEFETFLKYSNNHHKIHEVGVEVTYKFGESYLEKQIRLLNAKLDKINQTPNESVEIYLPDNNSIGIRRSF